MTRYEENMDPDLRPSARVMEDLGFGAAQLDLETIRSLRQSTRARADAAQAGRSGSGAVAFEDRLVPGPSGQPDVRLRIYRPAAITTVQPCLYWIHGGGMVMGSVEAGDATCEEYAERVGCVVVSVDYRLAPEHPHPAPVEDCYAGLRWIAEQSQELGLDPARIAIGGNSAGGGLAAATALLARDRGTPALAFQLLICPMLDDRNDSPSAVEFTGISTWSREFNRGGWAALLGDRAGTDDVSPYAAPARSDDLRELPPALIQVGELEVFRDEDIEYAMRLMQAGVAAELHVYPGAFHGWDGMAPTSGSAQRMVAERMGALARALGSRG